MYTEFWLGYLSGSEEVRMITESQVVMNVAQDSAIEQA